MRELVIADFDLHIHDGNLMLEMLVLLVTDHICDMWADEFGPLQMRFVILFSISLQWIPYLY